MKVFLFYLSTLLLGLWAQITLNHLLGGSWFSIQILLVAVIYWGLMRGPVSGVMMGFGWGLLIDASTLGFLGMHGLLWSIVGYAAGVLRRQLDETKPWTQAIFTLTLTAAYCVSLLLIERLLVSGERAIKPESLLQPVWNALSAPIVFIAIQAWESIWDIHGRKN